MASNVEVNLIARTSDFEDKMTKATKTFEALAFKGADSNKALSKSFEQLNKIASSELSDLQKAFNALQVKGDFGIGVQKDKIAEAKRFYIDQFKAIRDSAETSAAETARAWAGLKNAFGNINKASGTGSTGTSDFKVMMQAQQEANAMNDKFNDMRLRSDVKMYDEALRLNQKFNYDKVQSELKMLEEANLLNSKFNYDRLQSQIKMQEEANLLNQKFNYDKLQSEMKMLREAHLLNQKFDYERMQSAAKLAAAKVLADQEALNKINIAHERALRMDKERDAQMAISREQALRKMTLLHAEANAMNAKFNTGLGESFEQINKVGDATERVGHGINGWSLASVAAIAKVQIMYSIINNIMGTLAKFPGQVIDAVEDYKSSIISNAAIITSMQKGVQDVGIQYQKNKVYAEGVQQTLIKMDANTAANIKNLGDMNNQFVQQGVLIDANNEKQKKGFLNIANYLATITAADPNKDMQYSQELRSMKDFSTRAGNRLVQYLETQGVTKEIVDGWKEFGRVTENNGYLLEQLAPYFKGFEAAQADINGLLATAKSTLTTIYTEVLRGGLTPAVDALNKKMNELVDWATKNKDEIAQGLYRGWLEVKGVVESVYLTLKLIKVPIDLINKATEPLGFGVHSIFEGWSLIGAVALPTVIEKMLQVAKVAEGISKFNLLGGLFGSKESKAQIKLDRSQLQKDLSSVFDLSGFEKRMTDWNFNFKSDKIVGENPTGVGGGFGGEKAGSSADKYNAFENSHYKALNKGIEEYNKKLNEQQKDFYQLSVEIDRTMDAEKRLFNLQNMQTGDLKTNRYKVTPLSEYRLNTNKQYSIPMSKEAFETPEETAAKMHDAYADVLGAQELLERYSPWEGMSAGLQNYARDVEKLGEQFNNLAVNAVKGLENALVQFTMTGKFSFRDMANSIISDLSRIAMRQAITGPLAAGLSSALGGLFSSTPSAAGFSMDGVLSNAPTNMYGQIAGMRANGGPVTARSTYLVGERGPELFTPGASGMITPNAALGAADIKINVVNPPGEKNEAFANVKFDGAQMIIDVVLKKLRADPGFRNSMATGGGY